MFYLWLYEKIANTSLPCVYVNLDTWNKTTLVFWEATRKVFQEMSMVILYQYFLEDPIYAWSFIDG